MLLGAGVLVNYLDRVNLSVSEAALHQQFGMSRIMFGVLLSAYSWTLRPFNCRWESSWIDLE